jgi:hypothetical protein
MVPSSIPALPWFRLTFSQASAKCVRLYTLSIRDWTFCFFPGLVSAAGGSCRSTVSSLLGLGLSHQELSNAPALTPCFWTLPHAQLRTGPSPSAQPFGPSSVVAHSNAPSPFVLTAFLSTVPRSDSWQRLGWNFASASIHPYLRVALGQCLSSPLPALSAAGATASRPYLPVGPSQVSLGHGCLFPPVSPAHTVVRGGGTKAPSPPECRLDHSPAWADRFLWGIAPFEYDPVVLRKPFRLPLAVDALPSERLQEAAVGPSWLSPAFAFVPV